MSAGPVVNADTASIVQGALTVHVWSDVACPWCYIGKRHLEAAIIEVVSPGRPVIDVTFHSFQLSPDLPASFDGTAQDFLVAHKGLDPERAAALQEHVAGVAAAAGLTFDFAAQRIANTRKAHQVLHLAHARGLQYNCKERLFRAHFTEGRDIGQDDELASLGRDVGLEPGEVLEALAEGDYLSAVEQDLALARSMGVTGVPFFVVDRRYAITGAQSPEVMVDVLERALADRDGGNGGTR